MVKEVLFGVGEENPYGEFFTGKSYLNMLTTDSVVVANVTFEPGCRNNWHIHHAEKGGGQILLATDEDSRSYALQKKEEKERVARSAH